MAALNKAGYTFYYFPDYGCYHGHTAALAKVHKELGLRGFFKTNSADTDPGMPNCYFFPRSGGMFLVVRFQTQDEHDSWGRTAKGERCCYYNCPLDLRTACGKVKGVWTGKSCTCHAHGQAKTTCRDVRLRPAALASIAPSTSTMPMRILSWPRPASEGREGQRLGPWLPQTRPVTSRLSRIASRARL